MKRILLTAMILTLAGSLWGAEKTLGLLLVDNKVSVLPISVDKNAAKETMEAVKELAGYIQKISGAKVNVILNDSTNAPAHAIWVGAQPKLENAFPNLKFEFQHPEEILLTCNGQDAVIIGRDLKRGDKQMEFGTANAVYTFIEKKLEVRWLWPGELGEDIIKRDTIALAPFEYRFHPLFRQRKLWPENPEDWFRHQRLKLFSFQFGGGHAFTDWWDKYNEKHPEYFALQPDGTRGYIKKYNDVKICMSNPGVWNQWIDNADAALKADPARIMVSASPNDGPGECICANCRAWDHPDGPPVTLYGKGGATKSPSLTDRHVKFWNIVARGLKERFPDREVYVGAYAYGTYRSPPVAEALDKNIVVGYVGHFPLAGDKTTKDEKESWQAWADKTSTMVFRPNLFHYSGGWLGLPTVSMKRTMTDFRFLAENKCVGLEVDTLPHSWAAQGVQFYLMAQLAYDPLQDGNAVLKDYYNRGFGAAAGSIEGYFSLMEKAHDASLERIKHSGAAARDAILVYQDVYTDDVLKQAGALMRKAEEEVKSGPKIYQQRVAFIRIGYDFTKLQVEIMGQMKKVRESKGTDAAAVRAAITLCDAREALFKQHAGIALKRAQWYHDSRKLDDYMGPPSKAFRDAAGVE
jgi:hypothetical protein